MSNIFYAGVSRFFLAFYPPGFVMALPQGIRQTHPDCRGLGQNHCLQQSWEILQQQQGCEPKGQADMVQKHQAKHISDTPQEMRYILRCASQLVID